MDRKYVLRNVKKILFGIFIITAVIGGYLAITEELASYFAFTKESRDGTLRVPFPYTLNVAGNTSFACESLISANIIGSKEEYLTNGIEGAVEKGTDKVAMNIKDPKTLSFLSGASIEFGTTEGDNFVIVENSAEKLMAVWFNENVVSTVVLNKKNGLAIWLKGNPEFPIYNAPSGQIVYLICR